jgi:hypothetical protein
MGPGRLGGVGASAAAVLGTLAVAVMVVVMVNIGGGVNHPLVAPSAQAAPVPVAPSQG